MYPYIARISVSLMINVIQFIFKNIISIIFKFQKEHIFSVFLNSLNLWRNKIRMVI